MPSEPPPGPPGPTGWPPPPHSDRPPPPYPGTAPPAPPQIGGPSRRTSPVTVAFHLVYALGGVVLLVPELVLPVPADPTEPGDPQVRFVLFGAGIVLYQLVAIARWAMLTYTVGPNELTVDSGILTRQRKVLPYARVQQVDIGQRFLHRLVGFGTLTVSTAGEAGAAQAQLGLLDLGLAHGIRAYVLERREAAQAAQARPAGAAAGSGPRPEAPASELLRLDTGRIVLAAVTRHAAVIGLPTALGLGAYALAAAVSPPDSEWVAAVAPIAVTGALLAGLTFASQAIGYVLTYHDFTLSRRGDDVQLRFGLTQPRDLTVPRRRVQKVTVVDNPIWRLLGAVSVEMRSAAPVTAGGRGGDEQSVTSFTIPILDRADLDRVLGEAMGPAWQVPALVPRLPAARRRGVVRRTALLALALLPLAIAGAPWSLVVLGLAAVGIWWGEQAHRRAGWAERPELVAVASGVLVHRLDLVPVSRIQSCTASASPFQRRAGLATIRVNVAGSPSDPQLYDIGEADARRWLVELPRRSHDRAAPAPGTR